MTAQWGRDFAGQNARQANPLTPDATDLWAQGYHAAIDTLDALPGPLLRVLVPRLLAVGDDTHDDPRYTAGYRAALHEAVSPQPGTMNAWPTRTGHHR